MIAVWSDGTKWTVPGLTMESYTSKAETKCQREATKRKPAKDN